MQATECCIQAYLGSLRAAVAESPGGQFECLVSPHLQKSRHFSERVQQSSVLWEAGWGAQVNRADRIRVLDLAPFVSWPFHAEDSPPQTPGMDDYWRRTRIWSSRGPACFVSCVVAQMLRQRMQFWNAVSEMQRFQTAGERTGKDVEPG